MPDKNSERSAARRLLSFSVPIFLSNFLQVFYALTDMAVVGRFVGETGLAAIANGSAIAYLVGSVGTGLAVGGAVVVGHYNGAANGRGLRESLVSLFMLAALAAFLITPFGLLYAEEIFLGLGVADSARAGAVNYFSIICLGNIFFFGGQALSFSLRSLGDSKSPLYFMLAGGFINIGLDLVLVGPLSMGVQGAALATVCAQAGALLFAFVYLKKRRGLFHHPGDSAEAITGTSPLTADRMRGIRGILRIGLPTMTQLVLINASYLAISALINSYGVTAAAAAGVGLKICTLAVMPCWAVGQSLTALAANSLGAGNISEAAVLARAALRLNVAITFLVVAAVQIAARPLMAVFNPGDPGVIEAGVFYLRLCCSLGVVVYAAMYTFNSLAVGAGAATAAMFNSLLDSVLMRLVLIWLFSRAAYGLTGIYLGQALSAFLPALAGGIYFHSRRWQGKKVI